MRLKRYITSSLFVWMTCLIFCFCLVDDWTIGFLWKNALSIIYRSFEVNRNGSEIPVRTSISHPIEIVIPRDPNWIIPSMILENITSASFNSHHVNITSILLICVHFQMDPLNKSLSYLLINEINVLMDQRRYIWFTRIQFLFEFFDIPGQRSSLFYIEFQTSSLYIRLLLSR
jgi:hypothetical protein